MRNAGLFLAGCVLAWPGVCGESVTARVPVLLELFTSEGCSSCPPADRLLEKLDREQPIANADLIVLSEHVDYWNQLGWRDPFSSGLYSERQRHYAQRLRGEVYTPEVVINGARGLVGSEDALIREALKEAVKEPMQRLRVTAAREGKRVAVGVQADELKGGALYIALAHETVQSQVLKGENAGRGLSHVAVVYSIGRGSMGETKIDLADAHEKTRVVAFVTKADSRIVALGQTRL